MFKALKNLGDARYNVTNVWRISLKVDSILCNVHRNSAIRISMSWQRVNIRPPRSPKTKLTGGI